MWRSLADVQTFLRARPNLEVADLEPAVDHLVNVFGFEVELREEEMGLALLRRDAVILAVVRTPSPAVNETTAIYVDVSEVDDLHATCLERGAKVVNPLTEHPWHLRDFVVEIPGGHRLVFGQRVG